MRGLKPSIHMHVYVIWVYIEEIHLQSVGMSENETHCFTFCAPKGVNAVRDSSRITCLCIQTCVSCVGIVERHTFHLLCSISPYTTTVSYYYYYVYWEKAKSHFRILGKLKLLFLSYNIHRTYKILTKLNNLQQV